MFEAKLRTVECVDVQGTVPCVVSINIFLIVNGAWAASIYRGIIKRKFNKKAHVSVFKYFDVFWVDPLYL